MRMSPAGTGDDFSRPSSPARRSSLARVAAVGGTSGKRSVSEVRPIRLRTVFTGPGFDSQKLASNRRPIAALELASFCPVVVKSGVDHACQSPPGISLEATLIKSLRSDPDGGESQVVIAREDLEGGWQRVDEFGDLRQLAASFFDGLDVGRGFSQANDGLRDRGSHLSGRARCKGKRGVGATIFARARKCWNWPSCVGLL